MTRGRLEAKIEANLGPVSNSKAAQLNVEQPSAINTEQFDEFDLSSTLWLGFEGNSSMPRIQLDDQLIEVGDVGLLIAQKRAALPEALSGKFTTIIKADKNLPMELITQVKQELREINALKIDYAVVEE